MIHGTNNASYRDLMLKFLPRPILSEADYDATQAEIDALLDKGDLSSDEQDYLDLLGTLLSDYERRMEDAAEYELHGIELIKALMELHDLKQVDLVPIFKTKSIVSMVLSGKRPLTTTHITKLAHRFQLPHALFFESE